MDIRALTPDYAVSPQIDPADMVALKAMGYVMVIDNRPDGEIGAHLQTEVMRAAAIAAGLHFIANPVIPGSFTPEMVATQAAAMAQGPVFAYCASGNRCTVLWELVNAGKIPTDEMLAVARRHGYNHEPLRALIDGFVAKL